MLEDWENNHVYEQMIKNNEGKPQYILHDGPPYANGNIHMGTALNKIIKDIIVRYKNMTGFQAPYVPGYDTHGLPIELKAMKQLVGKGEISKAGAGARSASSSPPSTSTIRASQSRQPWALSVISKSLHDPEARV